jgi:hypothetical protein
MFRRLLLPAMVATAGFAVGVVCYQAALCGYPPPSRDRAVSMEINQQRPAPVEFIVTVRIQIECNQTTKPPPSMPMPATIASPTVEEITIPPANQNKGLEREA